MNAQRGLRGDTVAGSCQSRMSKGISKPRRASREDSRASPAWRGGEGGDTPRGRQGVPREQRQPRLGGTGGQWSVVGAVPGAAGLPRPASTLHYGIKQPSCSALAPQSR